MIKKSKMDRVEEFFYGATILASFGILITVVNYLDTLFFKEFHILIRVAIWAAAIASSGFIVVVMFFVLGSIVEEFFTFIRKIFRLPPKKLSRDIAAEEFKEEEALYKSFINASDTEQLYSIYKMQNINAELLGLIFKRIEWILYIAVAAVIGLVIKIFFK